MDDATRRELRRLKAFAMAGTVLVGALAVAAFRQSTQGRSTQKQRFTEIDAERINVVEPDGKLRLTMSNSRRVPDLMIGGKSYPLRGGTGAGSAGLIFFNDEGNENGGLVWAGKGTMASHRASAHLTLDQFDQDEALSLAYTDVDGRRRAGITITDRPQLPIQMFAESAMVVMRLPDGPAKQQRMAALRSSPAAAAAASATRLYLGRGVDGSAQLMLADPAGRPRLRLTVDSTGAAAAEFLDETGAVTARYPR
jgi:hypothetical protein